MAKSGCLFTLHAPGKHLEKPDCMPSVLRDWHGVVFNHSSPFTPVMCFCG